MSTDRVIEYWSNGRSEPLHLSWKYDVYSDFSEAANAIADAFPPVAADLWDIAAACHAVDRRVRRPPNEHWKPSAWGRDIGIRVAVRNPSLWERHRRLLEGLLTWLTCDRWSLSFREPRPGELPKQVVEPFLEGIDDWPGKRIAMLFSGGADSTAGVLHEVSQSQGDSVLLTVSVASNKKMRSRQENLAKSIPQRLGMRVAPLPFRLHLKKSTSGAVRSENSQRTRGLVFLAAGIAAALTAGCRRLLIYENGIGAINLPCTRGQVGAQAARPVHPRTILVMQRIADIVADACGLPPLVLENKALWRTKAELIGGLPPAYDDILAASVSCDTGFAARSEFSHCGECSSCLLRRQALLAAGRSAVEHREEYRGRSEIEDQHLHAMLWQVARMRRALEAEDPWTAFVQEFPDVLCVPSVLDHRDELLDLYRRYCAEWADPAIARRLGFQPSTWGLTVPG